MSEFMQVACIGDTHLQSTHWRNDDRLAAFDAAISSAKELPNLRAIVHMGDVFHSNSTPEDRLAVATRLVEASETAEVLVVEGNHGKPGDTELFNWVRTYERVRVITKPELITMGGVLFAVLPYPSKAAMVAAGATREAQVKIAHDAFDLMAIEDTAGQWLAWTGPKMLIGHLTIAGAVTSVGQPLVAVELEMDPLTLARYGNVPKVFGHIHKHQVVGDGVYVGSTCRMDWGETERKGWLLVEFKQTNMLFQGSTPPPAPWLHQWTFNELPVPPMYHVQGALSRDVFDWQVRKGPDGPLDDMPTQRVPCPDCGSQVRPPGQPLGTLFNETLEDVTGIASKICTTCNGQGQLVDWTGCDVRVRAKYPQSERLVHADAKERIARMFPNARYRDIELISVQSRELRAPEVAAAVTVDEKLKAMARLDGTEWVGDVERCAALLLSTEDGDAVVADVEGRLEPLAVMEA